MPQKYEQSSQKLSFKQIILNNFIGGLAWSFGATIGLSLIIALLSLIAAHINVIPIIGTFISHILDFVLAHNPTIRK